MAALLQSGFTIEDPSKLAEPLERLVRVGFGITLEEECEMMELIVSEDEPDEEEDDEEFIKKEDLDEDDNKEEAFEST